MSLGAVQSDICPTVDQEMAALVKLMPRGKAWETLPGGVRYAFFYAIATVLQQLDALICALANEFFCLTASFSLPVWQQEYGFPDLCDPYPDLCAKVAAIGGQTCEYFVSVAASIGWAIACAPTCGAQAGCAEAGCAQTGPMYGAGYLVFEVDLAETTAQKIVYQRPEAGCYQAGGPNYCGVDLTPLDCVLQRIAPAHRQIVYSIAETISGVITSIAALAGAPDDLLTTEPPGAWEFWNDDGLLYMTPGSGNCPLPTSDPNVFSAVWYDDGIITLSQAGNDFNLPDTSPGPGSYWNDDGLVGVG